MAWWSTRGPNSCNLAPRHTGTHVYFDISGVDGLGNWESKKEQIALRIRQVGVHRILFGSDGAWRGFTPSKAIAAYDELPLTDEGFRTIDSYCGPPMGTTTMFDPLIANGAPVLRALGTLPGKFVVE